MSILWDLIPSGGVTGTAEVLSAYDDCCDDSDLRDYRYEGEDGGDSDTNNLILARGQRLPYGYHLDDGYSRKTRRHNKKVDEAQRWLEANDPQYKIRAEDSRRRRTFTRH